MAKGPDPYYIAYTFKKAQDHKKGGGVRMLKYAVSVAVVVLIALACGIAKADDTHAVTKEQLLSMSGKPDVIIIDVRTHYDWDHSNAKIKGAVREEGLKFGSWMNKYPKDKTIVLYCA
jgi:predicted sulfurtransferase